MLKNLGFSARILGDMATKSIFRELIFTAKDGPSCFSESKLL